MKTSMNSMNSMAHTGSMSHPAMMGMGGGYGSTMNPGQLMESIKSMVITMAMVRTQTADHSGGNGSNGNPMSSVVNTIILMIAISVLDSVVNYIKTVVDMLMTRGRQYVMHKTTSNIKLLTSLDKSAASGTHFVKRSSVIIRLEHGSRNPTVDAIVDTLTHLAHIKCILLVNGSYVINYSDEIELTKNIFARLVNSSAYSQYTPKKTTNTGGTTTSGTSSPSSSSSSSSLPLSSSSSSLNVSERPIETVQMATVTATETDADFQLMTERDPAQVNLSDRGSGGVNGGSGNGSSGNGSGNGSSSGSGGGHHQYIELYSYTLDMVTLRNEIDLIVKHYLIKMSNKLSSNIYYFSEAEHLPETSSSSTSKAFQQMSESTRMSNLIFSMKPFWTNRSFKNLFGQDIDIIRKRVEFFRDNKHWYDEKGVPYTLGILMSGSPGSGKTSLIKCLANETQRHIINIHLSDSMTKSQLENLFYNEQIQVFQNGKTDTYTIPIDKRLYVFEDIDCQCDVILERNNKNKEQLLEEENKRLKEQVDRLRITLQDIANGKKVVNVDTSYHNSTNASGASDKKESKITLSFLLNLFDGILETPGRIMVITTNFIDKLDKAFTRPGRIDVARKLGMADSNQLLEMIEHRYDTVLNEEQRTIVFNIGPCMMAAEVSRVLFENFNDLDGALKELVRCFEQSVRLKKEQEEAEQKRLEEERAQKEKEERDKQEEERTRKLLEEKARREEEEEEQYNRRRRRDWSDARQIPDSPIALRHSNLESQTPKHP